MFNEAVGLIETVGMVAAVEAADVACKTADIHLVGYQLSKGGGMVTVKIVGQVSSVTSAVQAAAAAAEKVHGVYTTLVIPRPHDQIEALIRNSSTIGPDQPSEPEPVASQPPAPDPSAPQVAADSSTDKKSTSDKPEQQAPAVPEAADALKGSQTAASLDLDKTPSTETDSANDAAEATPDAKPEAQPESKATKDGDSTARMPRGLSRLQASGAKINGTSSSSESPSVETDSTPAAKAGTPKTTPRAATGTRKTRSSTSKKTRGKDTK